MFDRSYTLSTVGALFAAALLVGCHRSPSSPSITAVTPTGSASPTPTAATVQAVRIGASGGARTIAPGATMQLTATAHRADGTDEDVTGQATWSTDKPSVATVSPSGLVSANNSGTAHIVASYQGTTGDTAVEVGGTAAGSGTSPTTGSGESSPTPGGGSSAPAPGSNGLPPTVQSMTIEGTNIVPLGQTSQLRAVAHMSDGTSRDVTADSQWSSTNPNMLGLSQHGLLTALLPGSNVVTAQYNGTSASQPVTVTPF